MRELGKLILKRSILVATILAVFGYLFAEIVLIVHRVWGGNASSADNADVRWKAPLHMAIIGVVFLVVCMLIGHALRRKKVPPRTDATPPVPPPSTNPSDKP